MTPNSAAIVAAVMAKHPHHAWMLVRADGVFIEGEVSLLADPSRVAALEVAGPDLIHLEFRGHTATAIGINPPEDFPDELAGLVHLAARLVEGPTRLGQQWDGNRIVSSRFDPEVMCGLDHDSVTWPLRRARARLAGRSLEVRIVDVPALDDPQPLPNPV